MKIIHAESNVVKSFGLQQEQTFKIKTNAHAFKLLSSGLYSDKETAVLREIGCNAYDAHVSIGKAAIPFDVKIPNQIDNQFYIRDYGPGLSDEDIKELYTTYFASTKQESNDYTGAFGLGSKSPFSYTDSFTITSYHGGMCRIYSAHIGDQGNPQIALMSESESIETGISIGFPVRPQDFYTFKYKAAEVFRWFKTVPNIQGGTIIKPVVYKLDNTNWGLTEEQKSYPHILMGNVCYKLDVHKLGTVDKLQHAIVQMGNLILKFPIGKIQVAASREELQYDEASCTIIKESLTLIGKSIIQDIEKAYNSIKTWVDKCKFKDSINTINRGVYFTEETYKLGGAIQADKLYKAGGERGLKIPPFLGDKLHVILFEKTRRGLVGHNTKEAYLPFDNELKIITGDATKAHARTKKAIQENKIGPCLLIYPFKKKKGTIADVESFIKHLKLHTGDIETVDLASFDAPPKVPRAKKGQLPLLPAQYGITKTYLPAIHRQRTVLFNGEKRQWEWKRIETHIEVLTPILSIKQAEIIPIADIKKYKLTDRIDWTVYDKYIKELLENKTSLDILYKEVNNYKTIIDLGVSTEEYTHNPLYNFVMLKAKHIKYYKLIEPILKQKNILDIIEETYKNSTTNSVNISAIKYSNSYKAILDSVGSTIKNPEIKDSNIIDTVPNIAKLTLNNMITVAMLSENAFITMMKEYLN